MFELEVDRNKLFEFDVTIEGTDYKSVEGELKFKINSVTYGFPVNVLEDHVSVSVPPLNSIVKKGLTDNLISECWLSISADEHVFTPWKEEVQFKNKIKIEAKMVESDKPKEKDKAIVVNDSKITTVSDDKHDDKHKEISETELKERSSSFLDNLLGKYKDVVPKKTVRTESKKLKRKPSPPIDGINNKIDNVLNEVFSTKPPKPKKKKIKQKNNPPKDSNDPIALMESHGMRNPKIQKMVLEKAKFLSGDDNRAIVKTLKKMLTSTSSGVEDYTYMGIDKLNSQ